MKRIMMLILAFCMLCACQPTPEEEFVVNKGDQSVMIEASKSGGMNLDVDLRMQYHIPERMTGHLLSTDGVVDVTIDAEIIVPDGPIPIVRIYAAEFEQPIVTALWNELVGDRVLYDQWENEETKADIENELKNYTDQLDQIQSGAIDENESMFSVDELNEMITELQARYPYASDGSEKRVETGMLHKQYLPLGDNKRAASQMGISARTEAAPFIQFKVQNNSDNTEALVYHEKDGRSVIGLRRSANICYDRDSSKIECFRAAWFCGYAELYPVKENDSIPEAATESISMKPSEAYAKIEQFINAVGLADTYTISRAVVSGDSMQADEPSKEYGYCFELVRRIDGTLCNRSLLSTQSSKMGEDEFAPLWNYESFLIGLDDEGIFYLLWKAPFTIGDTINENAKLLDFCEIQKIAERMLPMMEVQNFDPNSSDVADRTIDRIELGLWRIAEQNELGKGMLVPAYCFYGTDHFKCTIKDGHQDYINETYNSRIILILNAIDGSVIDPQKGY